MRARYLIPVLFGLCYPTASMGCSWEGLSPENSARLLPMFVADSDVIVHGRVVAAKTKSASIETVRSFKGGGKRLEVETPVSSCMYHFQVGEEKIYFIKDRTVWAGGAYPPSKWLIRDLEKTLKEK